MPQSIVPLDKVKHAKLTYTPSSDYSFSANVNAVPLLGPELAEAAFCFPIVFLPKGQGVLVPHAILGLDQRNIFVDDKGHWNAPYVPLYIANHPFSLVTVTDGKGGDPELVLGIDEDAPQFKKKKGSALFDEEGKLIGIGQKAHEALGLQRRQQNVIAAALAQVEEAGILEEQTITVRNGDTSRAVQGLRFANREKVMALPDDVLARWTRSNIMELLYAHWFSLQNFQYLVEQVQDQPENRVQ